MSYKMMKLVQTVHTKGCFLGDLVPTGWLWIPSPDFRTFSMEVIAFTWVGADHPRLCLTKLWHNMCFNMTFIRVWHGSFVCHSCLV